MLILISLFFIFTNTAEAKKITNLQFQLEEVQDTIASLEQGDVYYSRGGDWLELALKEYLKAKDYISDKADYNYKVASCYYHTNNLFESQKYFNKAYQLDSNVTQDILYRIGQAAQFKLQFDKAIDYFNKFKENYPSKNTARWIDETEKRIAECQTSKLLLANYTEGLVLNISKVNSPYIEHSPLISNDGNTLFFTSRRPAEGANDKDEFGRYYEKIFVAKKNNEGIWQEAESIGYNINSNDNSATIGLSPDNKDLYIYYGGAGGDIYISSLGDSGWSKPEALPEPINSKYKETAISFSPNKEKVYFVSNRLNGHGGKDIWEAMLNEQGKYKNTKVLGLNINTVYDERSVFIDSKGTTMYFSSEGHETMGGFDIFKSVLDENGNWGAPENIGYPVNTPGDDVFYITSSDNKRAYFSSIKLNTIGEHDIYAHVFSESGAKEDSHSLKEDSNLVADQVFESNATNDTLSDVASPQEEQTAAENESTENIQNLFKIKGLVKDQFTKEGISASIVFTDSKLGEEIQTKTGPQGEYTAELKKSINYNVKVSSEGYEPYETSIMLQNDKEFDIFLTITPELASDCDPIVLKEVNFEYGKASIDKSSFEELNQLVSFLENCEIYSIQLNGYTCSIGTKEFNQGLSIQRATSIRKYLTDKGIKKEQINVYGHGEDMPIGDNTTREGRIINRRVEFKLLK